MNRIQTRALVEGAIFAAITAMIGFIGFYIPIVSFIALIWAVPITIIAFRHGLKVSIISTVASTALVALLTGPVNGFQFFLIFAVPGIVMGYMMGKKSNPNKIFLISSCLIAVCIIIALLFSSLLAGITADKINAKIDESINLAQKKIDAQYAEVLEKQKALGMDDAKLKLLKEQYEKNKSISLETAQYALRNMFISAMFFLGALFAFVNFKTVRKILKRMGYLVENISPLSEWTLTERQKIIILTFILATMLTSYFIRTPLVNILVMNAFFTLLLVFSILGLSIVAYLLQRVGYPKGIQILILILAYIGFNHFLAIFAFADIIINVRKRLPILPGGAGR